MQTFLPDPNYAESMRCLDYRRLGKQRVEARQLIMSVLTGSGGGWRNHPACKMWERHIPDLMIYHDIAVIEWRNRGYTNNMTVFCPVNVRLDFVLDPEYDYHHVMDYFEKGPPPWMGDPAFHASHRAALLHKDPEWYGQFGWKEEPKLEYIWP